MTMENRFRDNPDQDLSNDIEVRTTMEEEHRIMQGFGTVAPDGNGWSREHMDAIQHMMETRPNPGRIMIERARSLRKYVKSKLGKKEYTRQRRAGELPFFGDLTTFDKIIPFSQKKHKEEKPLIEDTDTFIDVAYREIPEE